MEKATKRVYSFLTVSLLFLCAFSVCALPVRAEELQEIMDATIPRLMVTGYTLDSEYISPDSECTLTVVLKNYCKTKAVRNIKLSFAENSGDIKPVGMGTKYVASISAGAQYKWKIKLTASKTASIGEHEVVISSEFQDKYDSAFSDSDTLRLTVSQKAGLAYSGLILPAKMVEGDTSAVDMSFMNTGKCKIRNLRLDFSADGLVTGGTTFVGEIEAGQSASAKANIRAGNDLGEKTGSVTVTYEDEFGESYSLTEDISTVVIEKTVTQPQPEKEEKKNPQWWLFILIGLVVGGGIGAGVPLAIHSYKQRKEDELRL